MGRAPGVRGPQGDLPGTISVDRSLSATLTAGPLSVDLLKEIVGADPGTGRNASPEGVAPASMAEASREPSDNALGRRS